MTWILAIKLMAATTAIELIIFAIIWWAADSLEPHEPKNTFHRTQSVLGEDQRSDQDTEDDE